MAYTKEFFDLQIRFARKVSELGFMPLEIALLKFTNLYVRFVGDQKFDKESPIWKDYLSGLIRDGDVSEWTYRFYLQRRPEVRTPATIATFGCFSYAMGEPGQIRLHFHDADESGYGPLSVERAAVRLSELALLMRHVQCQERFVAQVAGVS